MAGDTGKKDNSRTGSWLHEVLRGLNEAFLRENLCSLRPPFMWLYLSLRNENNNLNEINIDSEVVLQCGESS